MVLFSGKVWEKVLVSGTSLRSHECLTISLVVFLSSQKFYHTLREGVFLSTLSVLLTGTKVQTMFVEG